MEPVIFVGAHPDDFTGCCGTALLMRGKFALHLWDFTKGERGLQSFGISMTECAATREQEERSVAQAMGAELFFCGEIDGEAYATRQTCERMAEKFRQIQPRAVFTHSVADRHSDHMMTAVAVLKALDLAELTPEIYTMEFSHQSRIFVPRYYVDISPVMDEKLSLIRRYKCQNIDDCIVKNKLEVGAFRGRQMRVKYAEAFGAYDYLYNGQKTIFSEI